MGIIREIGKDFYQSGHDVYSHLECAMESFYYGYIRRDGYSKHEFVFYIHRTYHSLISPFRSIIDGIKNLWSWRTVIWNDRQWDHIYLYTILRTKLEKMENFFYSDNVHIEDAEKYGAQIKECREIIDNLENDVYSDEIFKEYYEKYPVKDFFKFFTPSDSEKERIEQNLPPRTYTLEQKGMSEEEENNKHELFKKCSDEANRKNEEMRKRLFNLMSDNIEYWWD